jgi:hypothetical protein
MGVMISAFVSREFGFGMKLSEEELLKINRFRSLAANCSYRDSDAAIDKLGSNAKASLADSPFVMEFEYGASDAAKGYWCYEWMVLQLEDCIDVVQALYPMYDFVFMFDHSCGHDRKRPDGLGANDLNKGFGGAKPKMRDTKIVEPEQIGIHTRMLSVRQTQRLVFAVTDEGPAWMTPEERLGCKFDRPCPTGRTEVYKFLKIELISKLEEANLPTWGTKKDLLARCAANSVSTSEESPKMLEGWVGRPKGAFQILFERGFIKLDEGQSLAQAYKTYTMDAKKDAFGQPIAGTGLKDMIAALPDFVDEKTLLQHHAESRSIDEGQQITLIRSPKCHPEVAGEGIEYDWAASKSWYRRLPLSKKNTKEKFRANVRASMAQVMQTSKRIHTCI